MSHALVSIVDGIPCTTSQLVAETFGKRHCDVIRGIRDLQSKCPKEFTGRNFASSDYTDNTGRKLPMYLLTRDGLTLLVMGYTGKEAMKFKLAYIEAFNAMEAQLKNQPALPVLSTVADRRPLNILVHAWAQKSDQKYSMCWKQVNSAFGLAKAAEFPAHWIPDAVAWVQAKIDALSPSVPCAVPTVSPSVPTELAAYGHRKNFWKDLEETKAKIGSISSAIDITLPQSRSLGDRQNAVLCDTLSSNVQVAHNCLVVAQQALKAALSLKQELAIA